MNVFAQVRFYSSVRERNVLHNNNKNIDFFSSMVAIVHFDLQKHTRVNQALIEYFI